MSRGFCFFVDAGDGANGSTGANRSTKPTRAIRTAKSTMSARCLVNEVSFFIIYLRE